MSHDELFINGELLRLRREARGWVLNDMATRACMSVKQIRQLEEGGMSSFYSVAVKVTAAKKVAALLGVSAEEVFAKTPDPDADASMHHEQAVEQVIVPDEVSIPVEEAPHDSVEPVASVQPEVEASISVETAADNAAPKSKTSLLTIAVLFVVALAAAAYLQPKEEPVVEAAPPVQVLPSDAVDPASAASAAESVASSGGEATAQASSPVVATKPALAASVSMAPAVAASVVRTATPVTSAAVAVPATSTASKAP